MSTSTAEVGEPITFTADAQSLLTTPAPNWDFGDAQHREHGDLTVAHTYLRPGLYPVVLTATENVCSSAQRSHPQYVSVQQVAVRGGDHAQLVSSTLPPCVKPGETRPVSVTLRNMGSWTWSEAAGYRLGALGDEDPLIPSNRILISGEVGPFEVHTFNFTLTAPSQEGSYLTDWQMVREHVRWFGDFARQRVTVSQSCGVEPSPPETSSARSPSGTARGEGCRTRRSRSMPTPSRRTRSGSSSPGRPT